MSHVPSPAILSCWSLVILESSYPSVTHVVRQPNEIDKNDRKEKTVIALHRVVWVRREEGGVLFRDM